MDEWEAIPRRFAFPWKYYKKRNLFPISSFFFKGRMLVVEFPLPLVCQKPGKQKVQFQWCQVNKPNFSQNLVTPDFWELRSLLFGSVRLLSRIVLFYFLFLITPSPQLSKHNMQSSLEVNSLCENKITLWECFTTFLLGNGNGTRVKYEDDKRSGMCQECRSVGV